MNITKSLRKEDVDRQWYIIDATDKVLGRLSTEVANTLRGKNKPTYTPHVDTGDHVIIINAKNVKVTGNKAKDKMYYKHTGYIGNLKIKERKINDWELFALLLLDKQHNNLELFDKESIILKLIEDNNFTKNCY